MAKKTNIMKILTKIALTIALVTTVLTSQAGTVRGYYRSNGSYVAPHYRLDYGSSHVGTSSGYVYRNPTRPTPQSKCKATTGATGRMLIHTFARRLTIQ